MKIVVITAEKARELSGKTLTLGKEKVLPLVFASYVSEIVDGIGTTSAAIVKEAPEEGFELPASLHGKVYLRRGTLAGAESIKVVSKLATLLAVKEAGVRYTLAKPFIVSEEDTLFGLPGYPTPKNHKGRVETGYARGYGVIPWSDEITVSALRVARGGTAASPTKLSSAPKKKTSSNAFGKVFGENKVSF